MSTWIKYIGTALVALFVLAGCEEGAYEEAGEGIDEAVQETEEGIEGAGEELEEIEE